MRKRETVPIAPQPESPQVLATCGTYEGLVKIFKARRISLEPSQLALEDRAGLAGGYIGKLGGEAKIHNMVEISLDNNLLRAQVRSMVRQEIGPIRAQAGGGVGGLDTGQSIPEVGSS
ncbi:hypothetical protein [Microvirga pakistanensis]|uniref:hypothetical protein n=1 Tax=Microvirga pakistanensis TaxID=1682650 RepID=UPI00106CB805|nr:hypothetical protein [Microvirga pakistanensis]